MFEQKLFPSSIICAVILLGSGVILNSCSSDKTENISLEESISLEGESIETIANFCVNDIVSNDSLILITDWCSDSTLLYVYSSSSYKLLHNFVLKGNGPGEFLSPFFQKNLILDPQSLLVSVYDLNRKRLGYLNIALENDKLIFYRFYTEVSRADFSKYESF